MPSPPARDQGDLCVIYPRTSSDGQKGNTSLGTQEDICRSFAERERLTVAAVFADESESAKVTDRPAFLAALHYVKKYRGRIKAFVVYKLDRISRNIEDRAFIMAALRSAGTELRSATENIDETPSGRFLCNIMWSTAEYDNLVRSERCLTGAKARFEQGFWIFRPPPGYRRSYITVPGVKKKIPTLIPDPDRAADIRWAFEERSHGRTYEEIAVGLSARGYRGLRGRNISIGRVEELLKNPIYIGVMRAFRGLEVKGQFPPIIPIDLFDAVQLVGRQRSRADFQRRVVRDEYPLRGFVDCGACDATLTASASKGRSRHYSYYHHVGRPACRLSRRVPAIEMESAFLTMLGEHAAPSDVIALFEAVLRDATTEQRDALRAKAVAVQGKIEDANVRRENLIAMKIRTPAILSDEEFMDQKAKLSSEIARLEAHGTGRAVDLASLLTSETKACLADPVGFWKAQEGRVRRRIEFQRLVFPDGVTFDGERIRTARSALVFALNRESATASSALVELVRSRSNQIADELTGLAAIFKGAEVDFDGPGRRGQVAA